MFWKYKLATIVWCRQLSITTDVPLSVESLLSLERMLKVMSFQIMGTYGYNMSID